MLGLGIGFRISDTVRVGFRVSVSFRVGKGQCYGYGHG